MICLCDRSVPSGGDCTSLTNGRVEVEPASRGRLRGIDTACSCGHERCYADDRRAASCSSSSVMAALIVSQNVARRSTLAGVKRSRRMEQAPVSSTRLSSITRPTGISPSTIRTSPWTQGLKSGMRAIFVQRNDKTLFLIGAGSRPVWGYPCRLIECRQGRRCRRKSASTTDKLCVKPPSATVASAGE